MCAAAAVFAPAAAVLLLLLLQLVLGCEVRVLFSKGRIYVRPIPVSSSSTQICFGCHGGTRRPIPCHPLSADRCRSSRDENRQPRPIEVKETRPPSRVHQAHTVPGSYYGARGSQPNVADFIFFLVENTGGVDHWIYLLPCSLDYPPTRHTQRENRARFGPRYTHAGTLFAAARDTALA